MAEDVRVERGRVGVEKVTGTPKTKKKRIEALRVIDQPLGKSEQTIKEAEEEKGILMMAGQTKDSQDSFTLMGQINTEIKVVFSRSRTGEVLTGEEIRKALELIESLPGGKREARRHLRSYVAAMVYQTNRVDFNNDSSVAAAAWHDLGNQVKSKQVRKDHPGLALVYDYIQFNGQDPNKLNWNQVQTFGEALNFVRRGRQVPENILKAIADQTPGGKKSEQYQRLLAREGYASANPTTPTEKWQNDEIRETALMAMLGLRESETVVDPLTFWKKELYEQAVKPRLEAMRSTTTTKLAKNGNKMEIVQSGWDKILGRARLASRLSFGLLEPESELGKYLNDLGVLDYWRGKAAVDKMWSLYSGIPIESGDERRVRAGGEGLFSVLTKENVDAAEIGECCGPEAELQISKDDKVCDALNILYHLAEGKTYQQSLSELKDFLKRKYNQDVDLNKELPDFVKDAVMIAYFYGLDIRANGNKDARFKSWLVGEFENLGWVTDVDGKKVNLLGPAFALKPDDMVERGWFSGRNAALAFNAISGDRNEYNPAVYNYQRTTKWQYVFMYMLGLDRDNSRVRHYEVDSNVQDDENILPGTLGKFERFNNDNQDHRRAVFERLAAVAREDFINNKPSWDSDLRARVNRVLDYFTNTDPNNQNQFGTNNEIWFIPGTMANLPIWNDLNSVLEDPRSWGFVPDFRDSEMQHRTQTTRYTMHNSLIYDCVAVESAGKIVDLLKKIPNTLVEEFDTFPAQILEAAREMKHRYHPELTYRNLGVLLETASMLAIERFLQVQIPNRELIQKMLSEYKLFEWRRVFEGVKGLPINGRIVRSAGIEFFLRQIEEEIDVTETGLVSRFDDAIKLMVNILVTTEAFDWGTERNLFMEKRAFVYQYMSSWLNPGRPVESYKVPVVIEMKDGTLKKRQLCVQDLTYREVFGWKEADAAYRKYGQNLLNDPDRKDEAFDAPPGQELPEFFTPMTAAEAGTVFGGSLLAKMVSSGGGLAAGSEVMVLGQSGSQVEVGGLDPTTGQEMRVMIEAKNIQFLDHKVDGWQRPGETMLEGMRVVFEVPEGGENGQWVTKEGSWVFERAMGRFRFIGGNGGYSRIWSEMKGNADDHDVWLKKAVVKKDGKGNFVKAVHLPCLKMTEDQAQRFFLHRYEILFRLLTGRAEGGTTPGQAVLELDSYYENNRAFISGLIRSVKELELSVNLVQQKGALRAMVMKDEHLSYEFVLQSMWSKDVYAIAKQKEIEGNIEHGQLKQIVKAADAIRDHEIKTLDKGWWKRAAIWLNRAAVFPLGKVPINVPAAGIAGLEFMIANFVTKFSTGSSFLEFVSGLMVTAFPSASFLVTSVAPWLVTIPVAYGAGLLFWDKAVMLSIIRNIVTKKAPDFGKFFGKYFNPDNNKEDAFFPAQ